MVARLTRRSRKLSCPCTCSSSVLMRESSRSMVSISLTFSARSRSDKRLSSSRAALLSRASRSMNRSVTSSDPAFSFSTLPSNFMRSNTLKNSGWGILMVIVDCWRSSTPVLVSCSTNPPTLSAIVLTWTAAEGTSSTSNETDP